MAYIPWGDHRGGRLELALMAPCLAPSSGPSAARPEPDSGCVTIEAREFHLPAWKIPEFTGTLYEAAGQPVPVVLERPHLTEDVSYIRGFAVGATEDGEVRIGLEAERRAMPPAAARVLAAIIAARADEAERAPGPGTAADLAGITREALRAVWQQDETASGVPERVAAAILARYTLTERTGTP